MAFNFNGNNQPQQPATSPSTAQPPLKFPHIQYRPEVPEQDFINALQGIADKTRMVIQPQMINQQLYNTICQQYQQQRNNPNALSQLQQQFQQMQGQIGQPPPPYNTKK